MEDLIKSCPTDGPPIFRISITPLFDDQGASSLSIQQRLARPRCIADEALLIFETRYGNVPAYQFTEEDVLAFDNDGPLPIYFTNTKPSLPDQEWRVKRTTSGTVTLYFKVFPRNADIKTPIGPRVDMRRDQGGLTSGGRWFLPRPAANRIWRNIVEWDLAEAPPGTRAMWSYGEGPRPISRDGDPMTVANSVFMVGPIKSYPELAPDKQPLTGASINWFGELPDNIRRINEYNVSFFHRLAAFFQSESTSYSIFIRRVIRGYGGSSCLESYVFEYDDNICHETDEEIVSLLSHEMIHSFSLMDPEDDGYDNGWYIEGLAEFYSIILPYRFGLRGIEYLISRLNAILQAYGTSPQVHMDIVDSQNSFYDDWYAEMIPYTRGCVYLLQIDSSLRRASSIFGFEKMSPLDIIIVEMGNRWRKGEKLQASEWLTYLWPYLGDVSQEFQAMLRGEKMDLNDMVIAYEDWILATSMQEIQQFGLDKSSTNRRIVSGLVQGSRAAIAGLKDGDQILSTSRAGLCMMSLSANFEVCIERAGQKVQISYWPRSFSKARVYYLTFRRGEVHRK